MIRYLGSKAFVTSVLLMAADAHAQIETSCTLNGEPIPCGDIPVELQSMKNSMLIVLPLVLIMALLSIAALCFWVWMLIECLSSKCSDKLAWVVVLLFLNFPGALLYFFLVHRKAQSGAVAGTET